MATEKLPRGRRDTRQRDLDTFTHHGSVLPGPTGAFPNGIHENVYPFVCRALSMLVLQGNQNAVLSQSRKMILNQSEVI